MKNLKKVLALVLVIASLMGLATMASATTSKDYSDADSISHTEAVDVMSTIGVFDGISGAFSGDSILTREQAAKIITYMILGKDQADDLVASVAPYTDVARDRWSAGSIAYCKNAGILAGVGNGRFEPDGKLTGVAFAKMCLVALGYDPEIQKLTGSDWAVNTSKLAIAEAGITTDLSQPSLADEMSREDACQMAFNTIQADLVDYESRGTNISVNGANVSIGSSLAKPVSTQTGWKDTDRRDGNMYAEAYEKGRDGIEQFAEKYFVNLRKSATVTDSLGRPAVTWTYNADKIGTYRRENWLVKSWTTSAPRNEMYNAIGSATYDNMKMYTDSDWINVWTPNNNNNNNNNNYWGVGTYQPSRLQVHVDGQYIAKYGDSTTNDALRRADQDVIDAFFAKNSSKAAGTEIVYVNSTNNPGFKGNIGKTGNGVLTELYRNSKGDVWVALINTYLVQATADYNTVMKRVNVEAMPIDANEEVPVGWLPTYIDGEDFDVSGVKEGDYLLLTVSVPREGFHTGANGKTKIETVTPATIQTAAVTEYTEQEYVTMGGTKYSYNKILGEDEKGESFVINSEATLVLDTYGHIMYVAEAMNNSNFVYIDNYAEGTHLRRSFIADAYFADGTNAEITVGKIDGYRIGNDIAKYRARDLWTDQGYETEGKRIPSKDVSGTNWNDKTIIGTTYIDGQKFAHWYTFSGAGSSEYTLRTPGRNRYDEPQSILTKPNTSGEDWTLIKNGTVRFMGDMADTTNARVMDMYKLKYDTDPAKRMKSSEDKVEMISTAAGLATELNAVRGNAKTVFVIKDAKGDVNSYTGIANVPTVKLSGTSKTGNNHTGLAKVSWINRKSTDYASFVFVDVSNTGDVSVDDNSSIADYMFTLKDTKNRTYIDGLDYLKYTVVIDGKVEDRWISAAILGNGDEGKLFKKIKEDSRGRITSGTEVESDAGTKQCKAEIDWIALDKVTNKYDNMKSTIAQRASALSILTDEDNLLVRNASYAAGNDTGVVSNVDVNNKPIYVNDLYATSKSNINLVIKGNDSNNSDIIDFLADKGADYEVHQNVSIGYIAGMLQNYRLTATVYAVVTEENGDVIDTMWIYVTDARAKGAPQ